MHEDQTEDTSLQPHIVPGTLPELHNKNNKAFHKGVNLKRHKYSNIKLEKKLSIKKINQHHSYTNGLNTFTAQVKNIMERKLKH